MKETLHIYFDADARDLDVPELASLLSSDSTSQLIIQETSELTGLLLDTLQDRGIHFGHFHVREYTEQEVRAFSHATLRIKHRWGALEYQDYLAEYFEFPVPGCRACRRGAVQKADFRFRRPPKTKHSIFEVDDLIRSEVFSVKLIQELQCAGLCGWGTRPIRDRRGELIEGWEQFLVTDVLPPASIKTEWGVVEEEPVCESCGEVTRYTEQLVYEPSALESMRGFALTHEYLGRGLYHPRKIVVSMDVVELFLDQCRFSQLDFQPIEVAG